MTKSIILFEGSENTTKREMYKGFSYLVKGREILRVDLTSPEVIIRFIIFYLIMMIALRTCENREYTFLKISASILISIGFFFYLIVGFTQGYWIDMNYNVGLYLLSMNLVLLGFGFGFYWVSTRFRLPSFSVYQFKVASVLSPLLLWGLYLYELYNYIS